MVVSPQNLIYILLVSAFGPYIIGGLRLDQLIVYFLLIFLIIINRIKLKRDEATISIFLTALCLFIIPFFSLTFDTHAISNTLVIAQIENYLTPIAVFIIVTSLLINKSHIEIEEIMINVIKCFTFLLCLNTLLSVYLFASGDEDLLLLFTGGREITLKFDTVGMTAASLALTAGRITGVFTQVFEAGTAYSLGLISLSYLLLKEPQRVLRNIIFLFLILIGGMLTFSKVFFLIGFLSASYFLGIVRLIRISAVVLPVLFLTLSYFPELEIAGIAFGKGFNNITRLFLFSGGNFVEIFTGGRFSDQSMITIGIKEVFETSPIIGFGFGSIETSDFSLFEVISIGGILGLLTYLLLLLLLFNFAFIQKKRIDRDFFLAMMSIIMLASLGGPIITANRIVIIFWIFVALMCSKLNSVEDHNEELSIK